MSGYETADRKPIQQREQLLVLAVLVMRHGECEPTELDHHAGTPFCRQVEQPTADPFYLILEYIRKQYQVFGGELGLIDRGNIEMELRSEPDEVVERPGERIVQDLVEKAAAKNGLNRKAGDDGRALLRAAVNDGVDSALCQFGCDRVVIAHIMTINPIELRIENVDLHFSSGGIFPMTGPRRTD